MPETLYATSHLAGTCPSPANAVGAPDGTWAGPTAANTAWTSRWAMGDPSGSLTGTQTIAVRVRKTGQSTNPSVQVNLYENGALVSSLVATTAVSSTAGIDLSGTFNASAITNPANVEVEVVATVGGGTASNRASLQLDAVTFTAEVNTTPIVTRTAAATLTLTGSGAVPLGPATVYTFEEGAGTTVAGSGGGSASTSSSAGWVTRDGKTAVRSMPSTPWQGTITPGSGNTGQYTFVARIWGAPTGFGLIIGDGGNDPSWWTDNERELGAWLIAALNTTLVVANNTWTWVAISVNHTGGTTLFYRDGATQSVSGNTAERSRSGTNLFGTEGGLNGYDLGHLAYFEAALTGAQIDSYIAGLSGVPVEERTAAATLTLGGTATVEVVETTATRTAQAALTLSGTAAVETVGPSTGTAYRDVLETTQPIRLLTVGDSITEGTAASSVANRWATLLLNRIRTRYGVPGASMGFFPPEYSGPGFGATWASESNTSNVQEGLGGHIRQIASGGFIQWNVPAGTVAVDVVYPKRSTLANLAVTIDGASAGTIAQNAAMTSWTNVQRFAVNPATSHTLRLTGSGGNGQVEGIVFHDVDPTTRSLQAYDAGHWSWRSDQMEPSDNGYLPDPSFAPHLIIDQQGGINDLYQGTSNASQVAARLQARIDYYNTFTPKPTIVVMIYWDFSSTSGVDNTAYTAYRTALVNAANANGVHVFDLRNTHADPYGAGYLSDGLHPNNTGHLVIADSLDAYLDTIADVGIVRTAQASLTLTGTAAAQVVQTRTAQGTLSLAGSADAQVVATRTATAGLSLDGTAEARVVQTATAQATLSLSGSADAQASGGTVTTTAEATLTLSGSAAADIAGGPLTRTAGATVTLSGSAEATVAYELTAAGVIGLTGTATTVTGYAVTAGATLTLQGAATASSILTHDAVATLTLVGSAEAYDPDAWRDITLELTAPTGHPLHIGPPRTLARITAPTGHSATITAPRSQP